MQDEKEEKRESFRTRITLGRTGLTVSRLCIGASYGAPTESLERAYHEWGINFFYWGAIRRRTMRDALRNLVRTERDRMVVALQSYDHLGYLMETFLNRGLSALGIEHADILILGGYNKIPSRRVLDEAVRLRDRGIVRYLALSGHKRALFGEMAGRKDLPIDVYMIRYNAAHRGAEKDVFPHLPREMRPGIMVFTATRWGSLLKEKRMPPGERPLTAPECYRFVLTNPNVDVCQTGPRSAREMEEALTTLNGGPLSEDEMERVLKIGDHVYRVGKR
jgi:aryl-alcohol dehydrogenase-like predicted oxidoreductase